MKSTFDAAVEATNLWKKSTCSIDELYDYLNNIDSTAAKVFLEDSVWTSDIQIAKNSSVLNADGTINWFKGTKWRICFR